MRVLLETHVKAFEAIKVKEALRVVLEISSLTNKYVQDIKIWEKGQEAQIHSSRVGLVLCMIRFIALLLSH